jgi:hypothetical protein
MIGGLASRRLSYEQPLQVKARGRYVYSFRELVEAIRAAIQRGTSADIYLAGAFQLDAPVVIPSGSPAIQIIGTGARKQVTMPHTAGAIGFDVRSTDFALRDVGFYAPGNGANAVEFAVFGNANVAHFSVKGCKVDAGSLVRAAGASVWLDVTGCEYLPGADTVELTNAFDATCLYVSAANNVVAGALDIGVDTTGAFTGNVLGSSSFATTRAAITGNRFITGADLDILGGLNSITGNCGNGTLTTNGGGNKLAANPGFTRVIDGGDTDLDP